MNDWNNWKTLSEENVRGIHPDARGVYAIRKTPLSSNDRTSGIIYIGCSGIWNQQRVRKRLINLLKGLDIQDDVQAENYHCTASCIRNYLHYQLEFSLIEYPDLDEVKEAKREHLLDFHQFTGN
jgi:hypothetical protein